MFKKTMARLSPRKMRRSASPTARATHETERATAVEEVSSPAVVLSSFPPTFTRRDIEKLFSGFDVVEELTLPDKPRFTYPLRTTVVLKDRTEALRAVKALHGMSVDERRIAVRMADESDAEKTVALIEDLADELKIGIMNTARVYHSHLATLILEVREHTDETKFFAFLQARESVTIHSEPDVQAMSSRNLAKWQLVASTAADEDIGREMDRNARLEALKMLQEEVEKQGVLGKIWSKWEGSRKLEMGHTVE